MSLTSRLPVSLRAAGLVVALAAVTLPAMPAFAQSGEPNFNFRFQIPGGPSIEGGNRPDRRDFDRRRYCLSDREIRRQLRDTGYYNIDFGRDLRRNRVSVDASYGRWRYELVIDRCSGRILDSNRLRRVGPVSPPRPPRGGSGFGLQFDFGR